MEKKFEDGDEDVEVRIRLPQEAAGLPDVHKEVVVTCLVSSLKVSLQSSGTVLLSADHLYEKVKPSEMTWYIDGGWVIINLLKVEAKKKWPALTDTEALERRFGPINVVPELTRRSSDGVSALSTRSHVDSLLRAAKGGKIESIKKAALALAAAESSLPVSPAFKPVDASASASLTEQETLRQTIEDVRDGNGRGCLHFAAHQGQVATCQWLIDEVGVEVDAKDDEGETPLMLAARDSQVEVAKCLLEKGADPVATSERTGAQAIHHAAGHGSLELVRLLMARGADVNAVSDAGPPLLWACGHGEKATVEALLEMGANPNIANEDGVTALLTAAASGETDIVELLVKAGADVNASSAGGGVRPLMVAANEGNLRMLNILLAAGADPDQTDDEGARPIQAAASQGFREIVEVLLPVTTPDPTMVAELGGWTVDALMEQSEHPSSLQKSELPIIPSLQSEELPYAAWQMPVGEKSEGKKLEGAAGGGATDRVKEEAAAAAKARGELAFKDKDFATALDAYTQAIDLDPGNGTLLSNRSLCWIRLGQPEHALADAQAARKLNPDWPKVYYREGSALRLLQRYEEAASAFFEGLQKDPENKELVAAFRETVEAGKQAHAAKAANHNSSNNGGSSKGPQTVGGTPAS
eukprot:TRINITY_DN14307_c0_g1_i1.p1 TRINITY_DN14307_c0_g1~~TRINITY_DN14307_c0_g1_i1.p1  ORF type:complete len:642 (+),score=208.09 TRINITY_DN14307_c0_g1_i1:218-2143(+)